MREHEARSVEDTEDPNCSASLAREVVLSVEQPAPSSPETAQCGNGEVRNFDPGKDPYRIIDKSADDGTGDCAVCSRCSKPSENSLILRVGFLFCGFPQEIACDGPGDVGWDMQDERRQKEHEAWVYHS